MTDHRIVVALGSNLGDRLALLQQAVDALAERSDTVVDAVSTVIETDPVGGPTDQPTYFNAVLLARTSLSPEALLNACHRIEAAAERVRHVRWGPRTLDVDLIAYDDVIRDRPDPVLPHPRAGQRAFVLLPWLEVDADAVLPGWGPVAALAAAADATGVRATGMRLRLPGAA